MIGFDFARTFNPPNRLGTATGIVNVGGFVASLLTILLIGVLLDLRTGGAPSYGLDDFKVALPRPVPGVGRRPGRHPADQGAGPAADGAARRGRPADP